MIAIAAATAILLSGSFGAQKRPSPPACATRAAPPAELASWRDQRPLRAGASSADAVPLPVGTAARVALHPNSHVSFPVRPAKPGPGSHAGLIAFDAARPGRYRVALGAPAWIEVVRDGRQVASVVHGHGPACTGIRKIVDFDLVPGRHLIEVAGSPDASIGVAVAYLP